MNHKITFTLVALFFACSQAFSQSPNIIHYQGVALNIEGMTIANPTINISVMGGNSKQSMFKGWPQPSNGDLTILTTGIDQRDELMVMSMKGKIIQRHPIENNTPVKFSILASGVNLLRLMHNNNMYL